MLKYFTLNTTTEAVCFIIALVCLAKDTCLVWRGMVLFLFITCITEMIGVHIKRLYLADKVHVHPNVWLYNILLLLQACFISMMFLYLLNKYTNSKRIILSGLALLFILYVYETVTHGIFVYNNITNTVMSIQFVLYCYYYYYYLLKDENYVNLTYSAEFWWIAGTLFYYFGRTACNVLFDVISLLKPEIEITSPVYKVLNIILYSYWSYSFICKKWQVSTSKAQFL
jgi:hypothetical protein